MKWFVIWTVLAMTSPAWSQSGSNESGGKTVVAVLPLDAVALASSEGVKITITSTDSSVTSATAAPNPFADRAAIEAFAEAATQKIVGAFVAVKRVRVVERTTLDRIVKEQDFQMSDLAQANEGTRLGQMLGAEFIVTGQLQQVSITPIYERYGERLEQPLYEGTVEMSLRLINVASGEVTANKNIRGRTGFLYQNTPSEAAYFALKSGEEDVVEWLRRAFPAEGSIFEIRKAKNGEAQEVVITCGKDMGVRKDDVFNVYYETEVDVDGRLLKRSTDVGKLTVIKLEQDGIFSRCEVEKGGKKISEKMAAGVKLKVVQVKK